MKILKYILVTFLISCSSNEDREKLIGNWYAINSNNKLVEFEFFSDSLIINDGLMGRFSQNWEVKNDKIYLTNIIGFTDNKELTYTYKLDESNEFLSLTIFRDTIIQLPELRKAKNAFDFFKKNINLEIELPESNNKLERISQIYRLNFNIYAGFNQDSIVVKTDYSSNLNNLKSEVIRFKQNTREELRQSLRFNLIADKKIKRSQLDSIKKQLMMTSINQVVRTYRNEQNNYEHSLYWFVQNE